MGSQSSGGAGSNYLRMRKVPPDPENDGFVGAFSFFTL
ncbi:hypothetical protein BH11CYA1_BH11CYA1_26210 [soil metagenome]